MQLSIKTCFQKYATFTGVASRPEYWWFILFQYLVYILSAILFKSPALTLLWWVGTLLPMWSAGVRRLHDSGRSGWWLLLPIVNLIFMCQATKINGNDYRFGIQSEGVTRSGSFCANCGNSLSGHDVFCKNCGTKI